MLIGYNTIRYFEDKTLQRWETADNQHIFVYFATDLIPPFVLISDTAQATATVQIFDTDDNAVGAAKAVTITASGSYKQLKFDGFDLALTSDEGCYYAKIVTNGSAETYYSEVFYWTENSTANLKENGLLKISATSSSITLSGTYNIDLTDITYECFFEVQDPSEEPDIQESGAEKPYGDITTFNTRVLKPSFSFVGNYDMLEFLSGLRALATNGAVVFTYKGHSRTAMDIIFSLEETHADQELISGSLRYTRNDYISSRNAL